MEHVNLLSIIIVNFNTYSFIKKCLKSIESSILAKNKYEIIIIDNNPDSTKISLLKREFPSVLIIPNKRNTGFAAANNQGIKRSKGKYVLFLNPDTYIFPETLVKVINFMEQKMNKKVGVLTCAVRLPNDELDDACHRGFPTPWNALCFFTGIARVFPHSEFFNGYHLGYKNMEKIHEIDSCAGSFMLIRRKVGEQVKWLDEQYFWYGEDIDFCYRVKAKGWKVIFFPHTEIIHYKGISSGIKKHSHIVSEANYETRYNSTKARYQVMRIFYQKHYKDTYSFLLTSFIFLGIYIKEQISLFYIKKTYENRN